MKIRNAQFDTYKPASKKRFEDRMVEHLARVFPAQCPPRRHRQTRAQIQKGVARAAPYGLVAEREICVFVELMYVFGSEFDADPQLPWAHEILQDERLHPKIKTRRLHDAAVCNAPNTSVQGGSGYKSGTQSQ